MIKHALSLCCALVASCSTLAATHPMDPLDENEIIAAAQILLDGGAAIPGAAFQSIDLREPPKSEVLAFHPGDAFKRSATVFFRQAKQSFRSIVNLTDHTFTPPVEIPRSQGQLGLTIGEIFNFGFLFNDPQFLAALALRGIDTPDELAQVFVQPLTPGSFGLPEEGHRIVRAQMNYIEGGVINLFARPIEGLQVVIDLDEQKIIKIIDTGVVPLPPESHNFDEATIQSKFGLRPPMNPIHITQPAGNNLTINGNFVEWQKWRFHLRFERRAGTVLSLVTYDGRSVMYQGSLSEIFVPYQDPTAHWFYRTYMDEGEFGLGTLASPLAPGLDVPENAALLSAVIPAAIPDPSLPVIPLPLENVIGIFERVTGNPAWRHFELFSPAGPQYEGRAEVELVVRMIAQVGNYDYMVDWIFNQGGVIRVEVGLTGIDALKAVASTKLSDPTAAEDTQFGTLVAPNVVATYHSHHFNFRLDLDIDGPNNSFSLGEFKIDTHFKSPRKSIWVAEEKVLGKESQGKIDGGDIWRIFNPAKKNALGYNTSYLLESHTHSEPLLKKQDYERAQFIENSLWVTAFDRDELYAAGDTPNQNPGAGGLPQYIANNQSIANTDIVLWHTLSFHHLTAAEDFPVLNREHLSFELKPANFFDRNPALDLRRAPFEVTP
jgi:primary-amine oxidase